MTETNFISPARRGRHWREVCRVGVGFMMRVGVAPSPTTSRKICPTPSQRPGGCASPLTCVGQRPRRRKRIDERSRGLLPRTRRTPLAAPRPRSGAPTATVSSNASGRGRGCRCPFIRAPQGGRLDARERSPRASRSGRLRAPGRSPPGLAHRSARAVPNYVGIPARACHSITRCFAPSVGVLQAVSSRRRQALLAPGGGSYSAAVSVHTDHARLPAAGSRNPPPDGSCAGTLPPPAPPPPPSVADPSPVGPPSRGPVCPLSVPPPPCHGSRDSSATCGRRAA